MVAVTSASPKAVVVATMLCYSGTLRQGSNVNMQIRSENPKFALATIFLHISV